MNFKYINKNERNINRGSRQMEYSLKGLQITLTIKNTWTVNVSLDGTWNINSKLLNS